MKLTDPRPTRRAALAGLAATPLFARAAHAQVSPPKLGDDGLYHFDWFLESFLDFREDLDAAAARGRRFVILWSQKGCVYCKKMATEYLVDPKVAGYIREKFDVLHLDMFGARECVDFDGAKFSEKSIGLRYQIRVTPTLIFFPETSAGLAAKSELDREIGRMPGLLPKSQFLAMFTYVGEKAYEKGSFGDWVKKQG